MVANYEGSYAIVRRDEYGFILVNFERLISLSAQSLAFPMHVEQVFVAKYVKSRKNWKVVLH